VSIAQESHFSFVGQVGDYPGRRLRQGVNLGTTQCPILGKIYNGITLILMDQGILETCTMLVYGKKDLNFDEAVFTQPPNVPWKNNSLLISVEIDRISFCAIRNITKTGQPGVLND
jgi:hypothetical protein